MTVTFCEDCENIVESSRKLAPRLWLCAKFKRLEGIGFVSRTVWSEHEPYMRCVGINGGDCPLFKPRESNDAV